MEVKTLKKYDESLPLGIIQTTVDESTAWNLRGIEQDNMNPYAGKSVMEEIRHGFKGFYEKQESAPRIVVLPELSIPHSGIKTIEKYAKVIDAVVIGGCDFFTDRDKKTARNKGVLVIPNKWPKIEPAYACTKVFYGKTHFSEEELNFFRRRGLNGVSEMPVYMIDADKYGRIGVAICSDFYDLDRFVIYKGKIHHLIIIAYNQDYKSFEFIAEAISRLLLCNVVICNTGHYGNSLAYSPYSKEYKRTIYKASGAGLFTSQVIELPVFELNENQKKAHEKYQKNADISSKSEEFKWPPGYLKWDV